MSSILFKCRHCGKEISRASSSILRIAQANNPKWQRSCPSCNKRFDWKKAIIRSSNNRAVLERLLIIEVDATDENDINTMFYYHSVEVNKVIGPLPAANILLLNSIGTIDIDTLLCKGGSKTWKPLSQYKEFRDIDITKTISKHSSRQFIPDMCSAQHGVDNSSSLSQSPPQRQPIPRNPDKTSSVTNETSEVKGSSISPSSPPSSLSQSSPQRQPIPRNPDKTSSVTNETSEVKGSSISPSSPPSSAPGVFQNLFGLLVKGAIFLFLIFITFGGRACREQERNKKNIDALRQYQQTHPHQWNR